MSTDESESNHESGNEERSDGGKEDDEDAKDDEDTKCLAVGESTAEEDERLISGAEEVEEDPGAEETQKEEKGEGMGKKRKGKNQTNHRQIIDSEIRVILADTERGFRERLRLGESGTVNKFGPGTTLGEPIAEGIIEVGNENPKRGSGDGRLGFGGLGS